MTEDALAGFLNSVATQAQASDPAIANTKITSKPEEATTFVGPQPAANDDGLAGFLDSIEQRKTEQIGKVLSVIYADGGKTDPESYATARRLAQRDGLETNGVLNELPKHLKAEQVSEYRALLSAASPVVRDYFAFQDYGQTTKVDDLKRLGVQDSLLAGVKFAYQRGSDQVALGDYYWRKMMGEQLSPDEQIDLDARRARGDMSGSYNASWLGALPAASAEMIPYAWESLKYGLGTYAAVVGASTAVGAGAGAIGFGAGAAPGAAAGFTLSQPYAGWAGLGAGALRVAQIEAGNAYGDIMDLKAPDGSSIDPQVAKAVSLVVGGINGALEVTGEAALAKATGLTKIAIRPLIRQGVARILQNPTTYAALRHAVGEAGKGMLAEIGTENLQEVSNIIGAEVAKSMSPGNFQGATGSEIATRLMDITEKTAQAVIIPGVVGLGVHARTNLREVKASEKQAEIFKKLHENAKGFELPVNAPDVADAMTGAQAQTHGVDEVHVPVQALETLFQSGELTPADMEKVVPGFQANLEESRRTGRDVPISFADFHNRIAPTELGARLLGDVRFHPELPTLNEAAAYRDEQQQINDTLQAEVERLTQEDAKQQTVHDQIMQAETDKLVQAGMTPAIAQANAMITTAYYMTQAARRGADPITLYSSLSPDVRRVFESTGPAEPTAPTPAQEPLSTVAFKRSSSFGDTQLSSKAHGATLVLADEGDTMRVDASAVAPENQRKGIGRAMYEAAIKHAADQGKGLASSISVSPAAAGVWESLARSYPVVRNPDVRVAKDGQIESIDPTKPVYSIAPPEQADTLNQSSVELRRDRSRLRTSFGLEGKTLKSGKDKGLFRPTTRQLAEALQRWQREVAGAVDRNDRSDEAAERLATDIADEVEYELLPENLAGSAAGWYTIKFQNALRTLGQIFPELVTDKVARDNFTALFALTSDGQKVEANANLATQAYIFFRENGRFPVGEEFQGGGERTTSMQTNLALLNKLKDEFGSMEAVHEQLMLTDTVSNLKKAAKEKGEELDTAYTAKMTLPYAALAFGPKLGAFYANLMGSTGYLTMDRWWTRSFNRLRGQLIPIVSREGLDRVKRLIIEKHRLNESFDVMADEAAIPYILEEVNNYKKKKFKNGTELEKAANTVYKDWFVGTEDQPFNSTDREFQMKTAMRSQEILKERGVEMTIADIQAVMWYYEKRLFSELGVIPSGDISYEEAANLIVARYQGGDRSFRPDLQKVRNDVAGNPADDTGASDANEETLFQGALSDGQAVDAGSGAEAASQQGDNRGRAAGDGRAAPAAGRAVDGGAADAGQPQPSPADAGGAALAGGGVRFRRVTDAAAFHAGIAAAKEANPFGAAVTLYSPEDYAGMDLHMTEDGSAGFAIKGQDIVSVFKRSDSPHKGVAAEALRQAVALGGRTLDAFDTQLPGMYAQAGFKVVSRTSFVDDYAPEGWDYERFGPWNGGRPDVVFMVYDPANASAVGGEAAADYDAAQAIQLAEAARLKDEVLAQRTRGSVTFSPGGQRAVIRLFEAEDLSTFQHEMGHVFLRNARDFALNTLDKEAVADWAVIGEYLGVGADGKLTVEMEEKWARTWERYLYEGRAPSQALQGVFSRFAAWMKMIYRQVLRLNAPITPEIRAVMDRMLATDEDMAAVRAAPGGSALFSSAEDAGMSAKQFAAYQETIARGIQEATARHEARLMDDLRRVFTKEWRERRKETRERVTRERKGMPVHQARHYLATGEALAGEQIPQFHVKLDEDEVRARFGDEAVAALKRGQRGMFSQSVHETMKVDDIASLLGWPSGDAMVQEMLVTPPLARDIASNVQSEMDAKFGSMLADQDARIQSAQEAVHTDAKAIAIEMELDAMARRMTRSGAIPKGMRAVATKLAEQTVALSRVDKLKAGPYIAAERRAAQDALRAAANGEWRRAWEFKRRQLHAHEMARVILETQEEIDKSVKYLKKFANEKRPAGVAFDYLDQIDGLLERFEIRPDTARMAARRIGLREYLEEQEANGAVVEIPEKLKDEAYRTSWRQMVVDDVRSLRDAVKQLDHLGRLKQKLLDAGKERERQAVIDELVASAASVRQRQGVDPREAANLKRMQKFWHKAGEAVLNITSSLARVEQLVEFLDGGKLDGPWRRILFNRFAEAQTKEMDLHVEYTTKLYSILEGLPAGHLQEMVHVPSVGKSYSREQIYAFALNAGNASNLDKMIRGEAGVKAGGLDSAQKLTEAMEAGLTLDDMQRIQQIWDLINGMWPELAALQRRLTGVEPEKVEARSFVFKGQEFRGGYYPMVYDPNYSTQVERRVDAEADRLMVDKSFVRPVVQSGHRIARTAYASPVATNLNVIADHLKKTIHDVTHWEAVRDVYSIVADPQIQEAVDNVFGRQIRKSLVVWVNRVANEGKTSPPADGFSKTAAPLRERASLMGMGFRFSTAFAQLVGFSNSLEHVSAKNLALALAKAPQIVANTGISDWIKEQSGEMRHRQNTLERSILENMRKATGDDSLLNKFRRYAYYGIAFTDRLVSEATWLAGYNDQLEKDPTNHDLAVQAGDRAVRLSQGAGGAKDISAIENDRGMFSLFTQFYSYFNLYFNRLWALGRDARTSAVDGTLIEDAPQLLARLTFHTILPAVLGDLIVGRGPDDKDEKDKGWLRAWATWAGLKVITYPLGSVPLAREIGRLLESGRDLGAAPFMRPFEETGKLLIKGEAAIADPAANARQAVKSAANLTGYIFGIPMGQLITTGDNLWQGVEKNDWRLRDLLLAREPHRQ